MKKGIVVVLTLVIAIMACGIAMAKGKPGGGGKPPRAPEMVLIALTGDLEGSAMVNKAALFSDRGRPEIVLALSGPFPFSDVHATYTGVIGLATTGPKSGNIYFHAWDDNVHLYLLDGSVNRETGTWTYVDDRTNYFDTQGTNLWADGNCVLTITPQ